MLTSWLQLHRPILRATRPSGTFRILSSRVPFQNLVQTHAPNFKIKYIYSKILTCHRYSYRVHNRPLRYLHVPHRISGWTLFITTPLRSIFFIRPSCFLHRVHVLRTIANTQAQSLGGRIKQSECLSFSRIWSSSLVWGVWPRIPTTRDMGRVAKGGPAHKRKACGAWHSLARAARPAEKIFSDPA